MQIFQVLVGGRTENPLLVSQDTTHYMDEQRFVPRPEPSSRIDETTFFGSDTHDARIERGGRDPVKNAGDLIRLGAPAGCEQFPNEPIGGVAALVAADHAGNSTPCERSGLVIAEGTPEAVAATPGSFTSDFQRPVLRVRAPAD
jgi:hypothetical protein